jgi:formate-dependent nitrite reductase membrane component NrfD
LSAILLIVDLGRPERFLNMLRTVYLRSPLSIGSWVLAIGGAFSMASVMLPGRGGDAAALGAGSMGIPLAGYTGVLLANTAIPVWQRARKTLPVLSIASSAAAAASMFETMTLLPHEDRAVKRFGIMSKTVELAAISALPKPKSGLSSALLTAAGILTAGSLVLAFLPHRKPAITRAAGIAGTLGAIALRFSVFYAGFSSEERLAGTSHSESRDPGRHSV